MNTFKRKSLHAAVLAGLGAVGLAGTAEAVHVNPDHLGSVLIYPYYTVRADGGGTSTAYYDNYISIVNTTASTKAVKVRVLEGKRSAEVLDFNLFLSPFDVWTGAIVRTTTATDGEEGGKFISTDRSCVVPNALFSTASTNTLNRFKNFVYASTPSDGGGTSLDRAREGYLEIFEMGDVTNATAITAAKHVAGVPGNCAYFEANDTTLVTALAAPSGGLAGTGSLINVRSGTDYSYDAVAIANWQTGTPNYSRAGDVLPRLTGGNVVTSTIFTAAGNVVASTWATSRDAVSAAITQQSIFNEWILETATASGTDWVVTFPTKFAYTGPVGTGAAIAPFNANFNNGSSCDIFSLTFYNREEATTTAPVIVLPSPEPSVVVTNSTFCYEANVLTWANSNQLGSANLYNVDPTSVGRTGWASILFSQPIQILTPAASSVNGVAAAAQVHRGLPAVGFMLNDYNNGNVGTPPVFSSYGGLFVHKYFKSIGTTP
jgi:hypothetical protein